MGTIAPARCGCTESREMIRLEMSNSPDRPWVSTPTCAATNSFQCIRYGCGEQISCLRGVKKMPALFIRIVPNECRFASTARTNLPLVPAGAAAAANHGPHTRQAPHDRTLPSSCLIELCSSIPHRRNYLAVLHGTFILNVYLSWALIGRRGAENSSGVLQCGYAWRGVRSFDFPAGHADWPFALGVWCTDADGVRAGCLFRPIRTIDAAHHGLYRCAGPYRVRSGI
jgi:hypothetical protein